jgi:hypothetical protein
MLGLFQNASNEVEEQTGKRAVTFRGVSIKILGVGNLKH